MVNIKPASMCLKNVAAGQPTVHSLRIAWGPACLIHQPHASAGSDMGSSHPIMLPEVLQGVHVLPPASIHKPSAGTSGATLQYLLQL